MKIDEVLKRYTFGQILKRLREERLPGVSARELSTRCGSSASLISKLESDSVIPSIVTFYKVVEQLKLNDHEISWLLKFAALSGRRKE